LHLYRHPLNHLISYHGEPSLSTERNIREAEKCITRVLHGKWVCFDDFAKGVTISIGKHAAVELMCQGKNWQYKFPTYSSDDMDLIRSSILESLFEAGMVCIGKCGEKFAFRVTDFGRSLFEF